jgi:ATP citrate (pro-S)-lyase
MDYTWAKKLGMVRKPANFISSIADDRGDELKYCGVSISDCFSMNLGLGGVLSLLWFRRQLPKECTDFIEMVLMVTADHGPAVSGAHNTIVTARAGKDLVSSLCSGLLTIGPRFGGALDDAAKMFVAAHDAGTSPKDFVDYMKKSNQLIMGIGHRIKSLSNPDLRVEIVKNFAKKNFKRTSILEFALAVEQITTKKRANLILNVDGCIAVCFVDMLRSCGAFSREEADDMMSFGCLNGLFVLGRSIGFIGHFLDQLRLKQPLYRHPWDDITYIQELAGES